MKVSGWISDPKHKVEACVPSNETQLVFVNGRPVTYRKIRNLINSIWSSNSLKSKPCFFLNLELPTGSVDVNVTPDKQKIMLRDEDDFLSVLSAKFYDILTLTEQVWSCNLSQQVLPVVKTPNPDVVETLGKITKPSREARPSECISEGSTVIETPVTETPSQEEIQSSLDASSLNCVQDTPSFGNSVS